MGLFNYVHCEIDLPDGFTGTLRTKDLDAALMHMKITASGRLLQLDQHYETVPMHERPHPDHPRLGLFGSLRVVTETWRDLDFHGDLHLYGYETAPGPMHLYCARFTHGQLEWFRTIEQAPHRSSDKRD